MVATKRIHYTVEPVCSWLSEQCPVTKKWAKTKPGPVSGYDVSFLESDGLHVVRCYNEKDKKLAEAYAAELNEYRPAPEHDLILEKYNTRYYFHKGRCVGWQVENHAFWTHKADTAWAKSRLLECDVIWQSSDEAYQETIDNGNDN